MISTSQLATDFLAVVADMPTTFTFNSVSYTGALNLLSAGNKLDPGGYIDEYDAQLYAAVSLFGTLPVKGQTVTIGSTSYRIEKVTSYPDSACIRMDLISKEK